MIISKASPDQLALAAIQNIKEKEFWLTQLSGNLVKSNFPFDYKKNAQSTPHKHDIKHIKFRFSGEIFSRLTKLSKGSDHTLNVILTAGLVVLLYKYTNSTDILIGAPIYKQDIESETGFINTLLALRNRFDEHTTFKQILVQVGRTIVEATEHYNYPIEMLPGKLNLAVSEGEFPLFDIAVLLRDIHDKSYIQHTSPNMVFSFTRMDQYVEGEVEFDPMLYTRTTIERIIQHFTHLFQAVLFNLALPLIGIDILSEKEKKQLLVDFNDTAAAYPVDKTIHDLFEEQVVKTPDRIAVLEPFSRGKTRTGPAFASTNIAALSYHQLNEQSNQLDHRLRKKGVTPDTIVGIMVERSLEMIIGILGILKAGGAYLPIEPDYPGKRIEYILADSAVKALLTIDHQENFILKMQVQTDSAAPVLPPGFKTQPVTSLAYVIYTSGTTGKPKGALIEHRNVVRLMVNDKYLFDFGNHDTWTMFHSYCFDFSVWEMYGALLYGGKLIVIPRMTTRDSQQYLEILKKEKVTVLNQTPKAFYNLAHLELQDPGKELTLKYVIFGGDALKTAKLKKWKEKYPETKLINMFGITETTVHATYKKIEDQEIHLNISNIGVPIPTLSSYVMDRNLRLVPIGVSGELCVGGEGVGRGYLNRPELTKERFIENPYVAGERLYRSGDLGRLSRNGEMEYLGRIDFQVKIRGFRIEPGEIENKLLENEKVKEAVVIARIAPGRNAEEDEENNYYLCAYIVPETGTTPSLLSPFSSIGAHLKNYLSDYFPDYMIPAYFVLMDKIPLTSNGKVDRRVLPEPEIETKEEYIAPTNEIQQTLSEIWKDALALEKVGIRDNYFDIGGDSIKVIKLLSLTNTAFNTNLAVIDLFSNPTIEKLSAMITQAKNQTIEKELNNTLKEIKELKNRILKENHLLDEENIEDIYPMSDIEKGMVFHSLKESERAVYHDQMVHQPTYIDFDPVRFKKALGLMVKKHSILRTSFHVDEFEEPVQIVHKKYPIDIEHYDITGMGRDEQEAYINRFKLEDRQNPIEVSVPPLWRMRTFAVDKNHIVVLWVCHHAIMDGWSDAAFNTELNNIYLRLKTEPEFIPGQLKSSYKEFVLEQLTVKKKIEIHEYWWNELADYKRLIFPGTGKIPQETTHMNGYSSDLGISLLNKLYKVAAKYNTTLKHLCFAAYIYMLNMLSYENDITTGLVTNNRPICEDGEKILGCFLNTVPVRAKVSPHFKWRDYIRMIDKKLKELARYDRLSLFEIVKIIGDDTTNQNPIFDSLFNFVEFHVYKEINRDELQKNIQDNAANRRLSVEGKVTANTLFDFSINTTLEGFIVSISYSNQLFNDKMILNLLHYFRGVLNKFSDEPGSIASKSQLLTAQEKHQLLYAFNNTKVKFPRDKTIGELFERQVGKTPNNIVVKGKTPCRFPFDQVFISYRELNEKSNQLARLLKEKGIQRGRIAAIMVEQIIEMTIGIMGILKAGGVYLPIDIRYPTDRISYILKDSSSALLLTQKRLISKPMEPGKIIDLENMNLYKGLKGNLELLNISTDPVYVIYTSGSTGTPKGTLIEHQSLSNLCHWHNKYYCITARDRATKYAGFGFDASVWEIFPYLISGAAIYLIEDEIKSDIYQLDIFFKKNGITIAFLPTQICEQFITLPNQSLRFLLTGGDKLKRYINQDYQLVNNYGPTENTVVTTCFLVDRDYANISIGKPIENTRLYVVDKHLQLQPIGAPGELCISGIGLARGYLNRPELTAKKFLKNPFIYTVTPLYWTGDLVRWLSSGDIEFLGRIDYQVKIRGYRIELGEIEYQLLNHHKVKGALVLAKKDSTQYKYLCAYIVPRTAGMFDKTSSLGSELRKYLSQLLPDYMIPTFFIEILDFPLTPNGKIDMKALPAPKIKAGKDYVSPRNEIEKKLVKIWSEIFARDALHASIGIDDNFFAMGGHSLTATILVARIHKVLNVKIPLAEIFKIPTIRGIAQYIKEAAEDRYTLISPAEKKEYYLLSPSQKRLYILQQMDLNGTAYNIPEVVPLARKPDIMKLEDTFIKLTNRHESYRTSFHLVDNQPVQKIHDLVEFEIEYYDLASKKREETRRNNKTHHSSKNRIIHHFIRPFNLSLTPLLRVGLIKTKEGDNLLVMDMHHIISDGVSHEILVTEFVTLYESGVLPPLQIQYKDFSEWQNREKEKKKIKKQEAYWLNMFEGEIPVLKIPTDFARPAFQRFEGSTVNFRITHPQTRGLKDFASEEKVTLYMVLLAAFNVLLFKLSNQEDIVIGTPIAGRRHADLEKIIGMFVNTLALRNYPKGEKTFRELLTSVKERTLEAFENQEHPFEDLVDGVSVKRDTSRNPLFDVMFTFQALAGTGHTLEECEADANAGTVHPHAPDTYRYENQVSKFDITLTAIAAKEELEFKIAYSKSLFKQETIERFIFYFKTIIARVLDARDITLAEIEVLSEKEKKQILYDFNHSNYEYLYPKDKTIHQLFEEQVERTPDKTALVYENQYLTYRHLYYRSEQLAGILMIKGVKNGMVVSLMVERSLEMITGITAILKAGGAYLPLDFNSPESRNIFILKDSEAKVLLTHQHLINHNSHISHALEPGCIVAVDDENLYSNAPPNSPANSHTLDAAYLLYTSGTTGNPKGVIVEQRSVINLVYGLNERIYRKYRKNLRICMVSPYVFDASVKQIFAALLLGHSLYVVPGEIRVDGRKLLQYYKKHKIEISDGTPIHIRLILESFDPGAPLIGIKHFIIGGETLSKSVVERFFSTFNEESLSITNAYGPTECTVDSTTFEVTRKNIDLFEILPIGRPMPNCRVYIVDNGIRLQPVGVPGELCIGGVGVARGYFKQKELTDENFILNPFVNNEGERMYRTGDLGRWLPDSNIEFLGRMDHQVKIRGYRIELSEIESRLKDHLEVKEAVVTAKKEKNDDKYLCAYIISRSGKAKASNKTPLLSKKLKDYLSHLVPYYMIPSYFVEIEKIPLTPNGKLDRKALPDPVLQRDESYIAPQNSIEEKLSEIWSSVLGVEKETIGINNNFFEMGGQSLKATILFTKIKEKFAVQIPLAEIFKISDIKKQAEYIRSPGGGFTTVKNKNLVMLKKGNNVNHLFLIHDGSGEVDGYVELCNNIKDKFNCWGIRADRLENYSPKNLTIDEMAAKYIQTMKNVQPQGPYFIAGWSLGGTIAYEMVRQLEQENEKIQFLALIDTLPPDKDSPKATIEFKFSIESELNWIHVYLDNKINSKNKNINFKEKLINATEINQMWQQVVDYLEEDNANIELLKRFIPGDMQRMIPNLGQLGIKELIYYMNLIRTLTNARDIYLPKGKIKTTAYFFGASQSNRINKDQWTEYFQASFKFHTINGNHFSILKIPRVIDFAKTFDKIINGVS